ncbi:MAG: hypothetical protein ACKV19_25070 [Verrucomicrobiales bacterium]
MTEYEWRDRTQDGPRLYWAGRFARAWKIETRLKSEDAWTVLTPPYDPAVLVALRDVLWARYQRRKVPFEIVREIDSQLPDAVRLTTDEHGGGLARPRTTP